MLFRRSHLKQKYFSDPADGEFGFAGGHLPASLNVLPSGGRN